MSCEARKWCVLVFATVVFGALAIAPVPTSGQSGVADNSPTIGASPGNDQGSTDPSLVHKGAGGTPLPANPPAARPAQAAGAVASPRIKKTEQGCCGGAVYDNKTTTVQ